MQCRWILFKARRIRVEIGSSKRPWLWLWTFNRNRTKLPSKCKQHTRRNIRALIARPLSVLVCCNTGAVYFCLGFYFYLWMPRRKLIFMHSCVFWSTFFFRIVVDEKVVCELFSCSGQIEPLKRSNHHRWGKQRIKKKGEKKNNNRTKHGNFSIKARVVLYMLLK